MSPSKAQIQHILELVEESAEMFKTPELKNEFLAHRYRVVIDEILRNL